MPDVVEVRVPHSLDEKDPYRVFRFTAKGMLVVRVIQLSIQIKWSYFPVVDDPLQIYHVLYH